MSNYKISDLFTSSTKKQIAEITGTEPDDPEIQESVKGQVKRKNKFEKSVFYYLETHKKEHGIETVFPFQSMRVDGALLLSNGQAIVLEIKQRLAWLRACNARIELQTMRTNPKMWKLYVDKVSEKVDGGLIIFEQFSADWENPWVKRNISQRGWHQFYSEEAVIGDPEVPFRIAQYNDNKLNFGIVGKTTRIVQNSAFV
jgi:hypothetical protein